MRASGGGGRGGARALTPLVCREEELDFLSRRWERARSGQGQFVQIVGEPGIGKSRLIEEFRARLGEAPHTWAEFSSSQLLQNTPLHPIAEWGRQRFGDAETPAGQRLADLENTLQLIGLDPAEHAPLVAPLVDIPLPPGRAANLPPEELRRRQLAALIAWFLAGARSQPVALAFEDLHWADPTSLDLMQALAERGAQAPLLILATTRPEFRAPWSLRSHHSVISLSPLDRADVAQMVGELAARHALSKEVIESVSERTGGVPLFVEEVTRLLLERGEAGGLQAIPPTLQQSLAARLDRLGEAREVAQIGAVLGRDFSYALLRAVAAVDVRGPTALAERGYRDPALQSALDRLVDADLLFVEGAPPHATYRFKHALIQDAAYESLLKSRRQALHRRAADILRDQPERAAAEPEAIAHHFTQAGLDDLAIEWWARRAIRRCAARPSRRRSPISPERLATDYGLWVGSFTRGELLSMRAHAAAFLSDVEARPDSPEAGVAHRAAGRTCWFAGEYAQARDHLERALALFRPGRDDDLAFRFGHDLGVAAMASLAVVSWPLGEVDRAISLIDRMQTRMADLTHVGTLALGRMHAALFELMRGDHALAAPNAFELVRLAGEQELPMFRAFGVFLEGWATAASGAVGSGLEDMRRGVDLMREVNYVLFDGLLKIALAEAEARAGDPARAIAILNEALATCDRLGSRAFEAELHRARGEILLKRDPANPAAAEDAFLTAIAVAKHQGTRSFELRAALSLAKLYQSSARPVEAHVVLAPALEGFRATSLLPSGRKPAPRATRGAGDEDPPGPGDSAAALTSDPSPERERGDIPYAEMPELREAQALLAALAESDEVKSDAVQRQRLTQLHVAHGNALIAARGFGAPEATEAFARARESEFGDKDAPARLAADYGLWVGRYVRGELPSMRAHAATFLSDVEATPESPEAGVAHRAAGVTCWFGGEYRQARDHLKRALALFQPGRDDDLAFRFGQDAGVAAMCYLDDRFHETAQLLNWPSIHGMRPFRASHGIRTLEAPD